jgi:uncharacterized small protein (DUF1192 family)
LEKFPHVVGDLYVAVKNPGEGTGWSFVCAGIVESDLRELRALCVAETDHRIAAAIEDVEAALAAQDDSPRGKEALLQVLTQLRAGPVLPQPGAGE